MSNGPSFSNSNEQSGDGAENSNQQAMEIDNSQTNIASQVNADSIENLDASGATQTVNNAAAEPTPPPQVLEEIIAEMPTLFEGKETAVELAPLLDQLRVEYQAETDVEVGDPNTQPSGGLAPDESIDTTTAEVGDQTATAQSFVSTPAEDPEAESGWKKSLSWLKSAGKIVAPIAAKAAVKMALSATGAGPASVAFKSVIDDLSSMTD